MAAAALVTVVSISPLLTGDGAAGRARGAPAAESPTSTASDTTIIAGVRVVGYGRSTVGGAGGAARYVTNLRDSGPGSLRAALEASGRRRVFFRVGGTIRLTSPIKIKNPYVTINGGSANRPGITIRGEAVIVTTHDVVIRNLRFRPGDGTSSPSETDALTLNGNGGKRVYNVVVDHVTMLWGPDIGGLAILGDVSRVTIQNSIMGEGLFLSRHPEGTTSNGGHSTAANITQEDAGQPYPRRITFWHNLFTTSDTRMPRLQGAACVDIVNNVIFNWGGHAAHGNPRSLNLVGNWYRRGPRSVQLEIWGSQTSSVAPRLFTRSVYQRGNVADGFPFERGGARGVFTSTPLCRGLSVKRQPAADAYKIVLRTAGATSPVRDEVDRRVISNVKNRIGRYFNGEGNPAPNPYWP